MLSQSDLIKLCQQQEPTELLKAIAVGEISFEQALWTSAGFGQIQTVMQLLNHAELTKFIDDKKKRRRYDTIINVNVSGN